MVMHRDLVIPNKTTNNLRIIPKQEQDLKIWKDPVFNKMDFFISDAYERHKSVISAKLKSKKISNDQELIQSDPTSCPQNQKGNN